MTRSRRCLVPALLLLLAAASGCARRPSADELRTWNTEIQALEAEQDSLLTRASELVQQDPRLLALPQGDIVVSVPTSFLRGMIERVLDDVAENVTLSLGGIKAHVAKKVKKVVTLGEFVLDVEIHEVKGTLKPGRPDIRFGDDRVALSLPVAVTKGGGTATLHFRWDGKHVADLTCGDLDVTEKLTGQVVPAEYTLSGGLTFASRGSEIVCTPVFPETKIRVRVEPTKEAWDRVNAILAEKHGVCGWVLDKVNVPEILEGIIQEKGINVRLPVDKIRPFVIPAGVRDTVTVEGRILTFDTRTNSLRIDPDALWYSAEVKLNAR